MKSLIQQFREQNEITDYQEFRQIKMAEQAETKSSLSKTLSVRHTEERITPSKKLAHLREK